MAASRKLRATVCLLLALQSRKSMSIPQVMALLDVSRVSARRYLEALEDALEISLQVEGTGPDRRFSLPEEVRRRGTLLFSQGDAIALHFGRQLLSFVEGTAFAEWLDELRCKLGVVSDPVTEEREAAFAQRLVYLSEPYRPYAASDEILGVVLTGLLDDRVLALEYAGRAGTRHWPHVEPLALVIYRRALYLLARLPWSDLVLRLAVDRIRSARSTGRPFEYPRDFDAHAELGDTFGIFCDETLPVETVRLRFAPRVADLVQERRWHPSARVTHEPDGSALLELEASGRELVRLVLEFGPAVEVIGPMWLREEVVRELREALALYER